MLNASIIITFLPQPHKTNKLPVKTANIFKFLHLIKPPKRYYNTKKKKNIEKTMPSNYLHTL